MPVQACAHRNALIESLLTSPPKKMPNIIDVSNATFDQIVLHDKKRVVVDFWAPWCGPCKQITPILESILESNPELTLAKVNVDDEMEVAKRYNVRGLPTLLLFEGGELRATHVGLASKDKLTAFINQETI